MIRQEEPMSCAAATIRQLASDAGKTFSEKHIRDLAKTTERGTDNLGIYRAMKEVFGEKDIFVKGYLNNIDDKLNFKDMIEDMGNSKFITNLGLPPDRHNVIVDKIIGNNVHVRDPWPLEGYDFSRKMWKGDKGVEGIIDLNYFIEEWIKGGNVAFKIN